MSFLALHLILWGVFFWRDTRWTLVSPCAGVFAQLWNSALLVWKKFALFFSLCLVLAGIAGSCLQWRWLEPGPLCPFRVGHENCFYGSWKQFWSLVCAQRTIVFAGVAIPLMALFCETVKTVWEKSSNGFLEQNILCRCSRKSQATGNIQKPPTDVVIYFIVPYGLPVFCTIQHQFSI